MFKINKISLFLVIAASSAFQPAKPMFKNLVATLSSAFGRALSQPQGSEKTVDGNDWVDTATGETVVIEAFKPAPTIAERGQMFGASGCGFPGQKNAAREGTTQRIDFCGNAYGQGDWLRGPRDEKGNPLPRHIDTDGNPLAR